MGPLCPIFNIKSNPSLGSQIPTGCFQASQACASISSGGDAEFYVALEKIIVSVLPIKSVHDKWKIRLKPGVTYERLGADLSALHLLQFIIRLGGLKRVLEIGTYVGVSTLFLAEALGNDAGRVVTIEIGAEFADIARENFRVNGF